MKPINEMTDEEMLMEVVERCFPGRKSGVINGKIVMQEKHNSDWWEVKLDANTLHPQYAARVDDYLKIIERISVSWSWQEILEKSKTLRGMMEVILTVERREI